MLFRSGTEKTTEEMLRRFPRQNPLWGRCHFLFDRNERAYDWLVVYDDLPSRVGERFSTETEALACQRSHTLLITTEPASIKIYGTGFLAQFGHVLTSQEPWIIRHPRAIFSQPALVWFYGRGTSHGSYDRMIQYPPQIKSATLATVCSNKQQTHTLHKARYDFVQELRVLLPEMDVFGHGVRPIADKAEALDSYKYHVAIENHVCIHHWTEKLSDAFIGLCLPFYYGCPNAADYFPEDSFIPIDIHDAEGSARRIQAAIRDGEYERRLPAIYEARRRVLENYGLFATVSRLVEENHTDVPSRIRENKTILSRRAWRKRHPAGAIAYIWEKTRASLLFRFVYRS
jgi:hypothetical protein